MSEAGERDWAEANRRVLAAEVAHVRRRIEAHLDRPPNEAREEAPPPHP